MLPHVPQHVALLDEGLAAVGARVRPVATVRPPVRHQVSLAHEILLTEIATERPLRRGALIVGPLVEEEVALQGEGLAAFVAGEGTLAGVGSHVVYQVLLAGEGLGAYVAAVGGLAGVLPQVVGQVFLAGEGLLAELAPVRGFT